MYWRIKGLAISSRLEIECQLWYIWEKIFSRSKARIKDSNFKGSKIKDWAKRISIVILKPLVDRWKWKRIISLKRKRILNSDSKYLERKILSAFINVLAKILDYVEVKRETNYKSN